jgi:hypothetical protein
MRDVGPQSSGFSQRYQIMHRALIQARDAAANLTGPETDG